MKENAARFAKFWGLRQPLFCRTRNMEPREYVVPSPNEDSFHSAQCEQVRKSKSG
jgi:hypothetical protein